MEIAVAIGATGRGVLQVISDYPADEKEFGMLRRLVEQSGRPMSISLAQADKVPNRWRKALDLIGRAVDDGLEMRAQICGRAVGLLYGLELSQNPFCTHPSWAKLADKSLADRVAAMRDPAMRHKLLGEAPGDADSTQRERLFDFDKLFPLSDPPDYEPPAEASIAAIAARIGRTPAEVTYDLLLEQDGRAILYRPSSTIQQVPWMLAGR